MTNIFVIFVILSILASTVLYVRTVKRAISLIDEIKFERNLLRQQQAIFKTEWAHLAEMKRRVEILEAYLAGVLEEDAR